jgi:hypothetical protein
MGQVDAKTRFIAAVKRSMVREQTRQQQDRDHRVDIQAGFLREEVMEEPRCERDPERNERQGSALQFL